MSGHPIRYFDWEARSAIIKGASAWSILVPDADWVEVNSTEVVESGRWLSETEFESAFSRGFPNSSKPPAVLLASTAPSIPKRKSLSAMTVGQIVYFSGMHLYWLAALVYAWPQMGLYQFWVYAVFQYFYAMIWPVWVIKAIM